MVVNELLNILSDYGFEIQGIPMQKDYTSSSKYCCKVVQRNITSNNPIYLGITDKDKASVSLWTSRSMIAFWLCPMISR